MHRSGSPATPTPPYEDAVWAARIGEGDYAAFHALFHAYFTDLIEFACGVTGSREEAEGVVQDVFLNIWKTRANWRLRGSLRAYLYGAVRNRSLRVVSRRRRRHAWETEIRAQEADPGPSPEYELREKDLDDAIRAAVAALPERRRLVFILSRWQGLSYAEIAAILGITVHTVEVQMVHALKALRKSLRGFMAPPP